jgi:hypothetical protein
VAVQALITHKEQVPHEPGQWLELRELGWYDLKRAGDANAMQAFADLPAISEVIASMSRGEIDKVVKQVSDADLLVAYDQRILLHAGIVGWSYVDDKNDPVPVTEVNIDGLDEKTAHWAALQIVGYLPKEDAKNSSGPSTGT